MQNNLLKAIKAISIAICLILSINLTAQTATQPPTDSITQEFKAIEISQISIKSGEQITESQRLRESLISSETIKRKQLRNDSIISLLDSLLFDDRAIDLESVNTRFLSNKLVYWKKFAEVLNTEVDDLAYEIKVLNDYKKTYDDKTAIWLNTKKVIEEKESESAILERVDQLLVVLDSVKYILTAKSDALLISLNATTQESVILDDFIVKIDQTYLEKKKEIFVQNEPSIFSLDYRDSTKRSFIEPVTYFYQTEVHDLFIFLKEHVPNVAFQIILLIVLIVAFIAIKKRLNKVDIEADSFYRKMLRRIMERSVSAALIIGVFTSTLIFQDRPELLKDFLILCITIPIMLIASTLTPKAFNIYIYLFGVTVFLNIVYIIFPPDNLYYMAILMLIALIELYVLWKLLMQFYHKPYPNHFYNLLILLVIMIHFGFAIVGFAGLLYGSTTLAEVALNVPVANTYSGLLVFSTIIVLNGFISFGMDSAFFHKLNVVRFYGDTIKKQAISIVNLIFVIFWILTVMSLINIKRTVLDGLTAFFTDEITVGSASFSLSNISMFFFVIWLSIVISRVIKVLLEEDVLNKFHMAKGVPHTIAVMVRYSMVTIGVLLAVTAAGFPISSLTVLAGAFGVGIGFGLQDIFNNIVSGFILLFERPIQLGDTIEAGTRIGKVESIGIRSSNLRTFEGADVIIPNSMLISNEVVNWTLSDQKRRIEVLAGVAYGSDPHKVKELFEKVLGKHEDILDDPAPSVFFQGLGESSLDFRLLFWTSNYPEWIRIRSDIMFGVHDILVDEGISIPFPQMDLHLKSVDKEVDLLNKTKLQK